MGKFDPSVLYPELRFQTARSGGSGGQHVNKVETKVILRFNVTQSALLSAEQRTLLQDRLANRLTQDGDLVLHHQTERSQLGNREKVLQKFNLLILLSLRPVKARKKTAIPPSIVAERLRQKARQAERKEARRKIDW